VLGAVSGAVLGGVLPGTEPEDGTRLDETAEGALLCSPVGDADGAVLVRVDGAALGSDGVAVVADGKKEGSIVGNPLGLLVTIALLDGALGWPLAAVLVGASVRVAEGAAEFVTVGTAVLSELGLAV
jgi:hypothetical protein